MAGGIIVGLLIDPFSTKALPINNIDFPRWGKTPETVNIWGFWNKNKII